MRARSRELLDRAVAAMVAAIDVYNKINFPYRAESFTILALNGWELLLKAKWIVTNGNQLSSLFVREGGGNKKRRYKRTRSGNPFTYSVAYLAKKLTEQRLLEEVCRKNLEVLTELRDTAVHYYHQTPGFAEQVQEIGMAAVKNFTAAVQDWFNEDLTRFNFYLMPLSFVSPPPQTSAVRLNRESERFLEYFANLKADGADPNARYSVAVSMEIQFVRSKSSEAFPVRTSSDPNALPLRLTDDQLRERYPLDYGQLTERCRTLFEDFKVDKRYHQIRLTLARDNQYAFVRQLDTQNPKTQKKTFYSTAIMTELGKHYTRKGS